MHNTYNIPLPEGGDYLFWENQAFPNGQAVFLAHQLYKATELTNMVDDFGFVCFPKGPDADDYTNVWTDNKYAIPACYDAEKAWKIAFAYNLYTNPTPGYEDYDATKAGQYQYFRDTESVDLTYVRMTKNGMVTWTDSIPGLDLNTGFGYELGWGTPIPTLLESAMPTWQPFLDETNAK
jgi:hypothetical protein